jgi:hypothetical protein
MLSTITEIFSLQHPKYLPYALAVKKEHVANLKDNLFPLLEKAVSGDPYMAFDSDFYFTSAPIEKVHTIKAPTFLVAASNDLFQRGVPLLYERMKPNVPVKLLMLPGSHAGSIVGLILGEKGIDVGTNLTLRWFDHYLQGRDTQVEKIPNVTQHVINSNAQGSQGHFAFSTDWPHPEAKPERWYLQSSNLLTQSMPNTADADPFQFTQAQPANVFLDLMLFDTKMVTRIDINDRSDCSSSFPQWSLGFADLLGRPCYNNSNFVTENDLKFETPAMTEPYYINGPIQADLWLSSDKTDTTIAIRVDIIDQDGKAIPVSTGQILASMRQIDETRSRYLGGEMIQPWQPMTQKTALPLVPNEPTKVSVEIFPTSAVVKTGQKLRVSIDSSNQAMGIPNRKKEAEIAGGTTTLYADAKLPSSIVLPIVPSTYLPK